MRIMAVPLDTNRAGPCPPCVAPPRYYLVVEDWFTPDVWLEFEVGLVMVLLWLAETPLFTDWLPLPTCTPGLMFAPAFTALLEMFAFASTPTFGFTFRFAPDWLPELPGVGVAVLLDCGVSLVPGWAPDWVPEAPGAGVAVLLD
jgi:hypothetical protein